MSFKLGQDVYIKTDPNQLKNMIVGKNEFVGGTVTYTVGVNGDYATVYECELSNEPDELMRLNITQNNEVD